MKRLKRQPHAVLLGEVHQTKLLVLKPSGVTCSTAFGSYWYVLDLPLNNPSIADSPEDTTNTQNV